MNLVLTSTSKDPKEWTLEAEASALPEVFEAGAVGRLSVLLASTPLAGDGLYVKGRVCGRLKQECGRCMDPVEQDFEVPFNLLVEKQDETGLQWREDDNQGVEDYQACVGPNVTEVPLDPIIAEQVRLNYNFHPLPALDAQQCCIQCGRKAPEADPPKKPDRVDPRWDKLKSIQDSGPGASDSGQKGNKPRI